MVNNGFACVECEFATSQAYNLLMQKTNTVNQWQYSRDSGSVSDPFHFDTDLDPLPG